MEKNVLEFLENSQRMYGEKTACADMNNELTYTAYESGKVHRKLPFA